MIRSLAALLLLGTSVQLQAQSEPTVRTPTGSPGSTTTRRPARYPWHMNITATVFWVGEKPSGRNKTSNHMSSWDQQWQKNFGGYDNPDRAARSGYIPKAFVPKLNPFYIALPYNDCLNHRAHRPEAAQVIPWFKSAGAEPGDSVCHGRWVQVYHRGTRKYCFAQWEDCGPFTTDDWQYVFGNKPPRNRENGGAGIDVSPAVRDYLGLRSGDKVHWRFIAFTEIPHGPWASLGSNNPFVNAELNPQIQAARRLNDHYRRLRDESYRRKDVSRSK